MPKRREPALESVRVVLVEPTGPRNIGSTARAMKNFGLSDLVLVGGPPLHHEECRQMGVGGHDILEAARVVPSLAEALADVEVVFGTTARRRHRVPTLTPREAAPQILAAARGARVALVFGREDHGLSRDELDLCHRVLSVPLDSPRTSMNLAQAVLLIAYELFTASAAEGGSAHADPGQFVQGELWERLYAELLGCCVETGYLHDGTRTAIEHSLRRILKLGPIQTRDARHLFGLARRVRELAAERSGGAADGNGPGPRKADRRRS